MSPLTNATICSPGIKEDVNGSIFPYSAYFIEKHANDADGKNNPFDMDINSGRQNSYNQFASSQRFLHLTDINTFFYDYFYAGN